MADLDRLVYHVTDALEVREDPPNETELYGLVHAHAQVLSLTASTPYSEEDLEEASRRVQSLYDIRMGIGALFQAEDYRPWLGARQGNIDWYYWKRYRQLLMAKGFPPHVVRTLDALTDKILDHLEDPSKEGKWARKGLVVGHVQSGKTANYTGLIAKAADSGYKVIIVLAGLLNSLRNQTQERLDFDFMGWCTRTRKHVGAAKYGTERRPVCFTTSLEDFKKATANAIALELGALREPVLLILKKNKSTLENLRNWLVEHNRYQLKEFPMLLIDDEADHASINTNKEDRDPTAINRAIRDLLALFDRSSFVGYTATPFANIFIDPESEDEMENGEIYRDLFPRDFILSLDPPDNYVGADRVFGEETDLDCVREVDDHEDLLPLRHKIDFRPTQLPNSLSRAINVFILAKTIRLLRGQTEQHHSMMVNASRFTGVQNLLSGLILDEVKLRREAIGNYAGLPMDEALENRLLRELFEVWETEYQSTEFDWPDVQKQLKASVDPIEVISVNSASTSKLDYSRDAYPTGRTVIAVGGLGLSRGLTLEGLLVSYFLRNSIMYDTLMQMGRWFGYRDGYADVCRIFMTSEAASWYAHIAEATEELRHDFKRMELARMTPLEFGLRVRSHPAALIVTARNKMRSAHQVPVSISLEGRLAETSVILANEEALAENREVIASAVREADKIKSATWIRGLGWFWKGLPGSIVKSVLQSFHNHPESLLTYPEPLLDYIEWLRVQRGDEFDLLLRSVSLTDGRSVTVGEREITPVQRTVLSKNGNKIEFKKRRIASRGDERAGLKDEQIEQIKTAYGNRNVPDKEYRKVPGRHPLLMLTLVNPEQDQQATEEVLLPTYGISFPGDPGSNRRPEKLVEYQVNTVWWRQNLVIAGDEEDDEE